MYGISPFILLVIPFLIQIIWGSKAIKKKIKLNFGYISLITIILQIPLSILSVYIASENINANIEYQNRCGLVMLGIVAFNFLFAILLLVTIIVQFFIKRYYEKRQ
ncbi:hypothetical protein LNQ49_21780 [Flavobacterium sp. F-65]|jgi:hypothetical protein|uniref:Uncharacterized protein n=1 Tax=Flavobacterium pisciphilum TaxID=2893755 RepID=A0ABS8MZM5_9FLAO|nr:hypothetical protein [Flavobacterium sp. F-65]MCC9074225.1 hypothetical protein [Flavobacterium sp. F-65]